MSLTALLNNWSNRPDLVENIVAWQSIPARPARFEALPAGLHPAIVAALHKNGITSLYSHQAATWSHIQAGRHPVVVTGTASGKTLCYNLPVLDVLLQSSQACALYLFPTKALAHDQKDELEQTLRQVQRLPSAAAGLFPVFVATYDGDTSSQVRTAVRQEARLIISNPDMLHMGILPHHTNWSRFFQNLRFIVVDEMHSYRGVFGSHVANVIRRLKRIAAFYGSHPQFICTSATIANPVELAERLVEEPVTLVDDDGAAKGAKHFIIYNPPVVDRELGLRRGLLMESVRLAQDLLDQNVQTILFARTRRSVELLLSYLRHKRAASDGQWDEGRAAVEPRAHLDPNTRENPDSDSIRGYRSGYLPRQRREIEQGLRAGRVRAVVATSALELGIDIGGMEAALLAGYPGTIAQTWQQAGRAGRQQGESLALLVTSANPLDQFLAHHPGYFFDRSPEQALINPNHLVILLQHLRCAAFELPFHHGEGFGRVSAQQLQEYLAFLLEAGVLHLANQRYFWMADHYPAQEVSLRSASPETVVLEIDDTAAGRRSIIGQVDLASATWMVHPGAVYLHEGQAYLVDELDLEHNVARLSPQDADYYTEPNSQTTIELVTLAAEVPVKGGSKSHGDILVTTQVVGFQRIQWFTHQHLDGGDLDLPPTRLPTTGYWVSLSQPAVDALRAQGAWSNDPNNYGPDWPQQRQLARQRDGFRCRNCGEPEDGQSFHVHHIVPFRTFSSPRQANQLSNLVTLCPACHRRAEANVRMRSGLAGLAFAMGHLAPLFLMCDARDVAVFADPQSSLAGGMPAVVLYDLIPAGIGFSNRLFELHQELMAHAYELVTACPCADGCPSCVGPAGENGVGGKRETTALLEVLVGAPARLNGREQG